MNQSILNHNVEHREDIERNLGLGLFKEKKKPDPFLAVEEKKREMS